MATPSSQRKAAKSSSGVSRKKKTTVNAEVCVASTEGFEKLLNLSHDYVFMCDASGRVSFMNERMGSLFDAPPQHYSALFVTEDQEKAGTSLAQFEPQKKIKLALAGKDGMVRPLEWDFDIHEDCLLACAREEESVADFKEDHLFSNHDQKLQRTEEMARIGHWYWKIGDHEIQWSEGLYTIFGLEPGVFTPTLDNITRYVHKRDLGVLMQGFQRAILEKKDYEVEFRIDRENGDIRHVWCEGLCELDEEGDVIALFGIMQDITERVLYEDELKSAKEAAERAYAVKSQFLANMSHELRTPLNAVIGFSEIMEREVLGALGNEKYKEYVKGIKESGQHLLDLIADILDMSKIEAGKYELSLQKLDLSKVIKLVVQMMSSRARDGHVKVSVHIQNEKGQIVSDRRALTQILLNLVSNAVKFTPAGGEVVIECLERPDYVLLRVRDSGVGIPANRLPYITQPFEQVSSQYSRDHEGSGLGLAITKELIELHCGSLHIESFVGEGTTVSVRLPYDVYETRKKREEGKGGRLLSPSDEDSLAS